MSLCTKDYAEIYYNLQSNCLGTIKCEGLRHLNDLKPHAVYMTQGEFRKAPIHLGTVRQKHNTFFSDKP